MNNAELARACYRASRAPCFNDRADTMFGVFQSLVEIGKRNRTRDFSAPIESERLDYSDFKAFLDDSDQANGPGFYQARHVPGIVAAINARKL